MKRIGVVVVIIALLSVPAVVAAQYDDPYDSPSGGQGGGGGMGGGGSRGGSIQVGGGDTPDGSQSGGDSGGGEVTIVDFAYQPSAVFVSPGETVTWSNAGATAHTVDADSGAFDSPTINPGGDYSQAFESGVYPYHCDFHPNMRGILVVTGA